MKTTIQTVSFITLNPQGKALLKQCVALAFISPMLVACGGGGGSSAPSNAGLGSASNSINADNEKQVVAAVIGSMHALDYNVDTSDKTALAAPSTSLSARARAAINEEKSSRAATQLPGYCMSGTATIDEATQTQTFNQCALVIKGKSLVMNGSVTTTDISKETGSAFDTKTTYSNYGVELKISASDFIKTVLDGYLLDTTTATEEKSQTKFSMLTSYTCEGKSGSYSGNFDLASNATFAEQESAYDENGTLTMIGSPGFAGKLTIKTLEPMRYRDGYNDANAYAGEVSLTAEDGSAAVMKFVAGGLFVNGTFYTWEQYQAQFVIDQAMAPCLKPAR